MPTTLPRHAVTETPAIAAAIDAAAEHWPGEPRGRLVVRLVELGAASLAASPVETALARRMLFEELAAELDGAFEGFSLAELRDEWRA